MKDGFYSIHIAIPRLRVNIFWVIIVIYSIGYALQAVGAGFVEIGQTIHLYRTRGALAVTE